MELHPATLWEAFADRVPDRTALVQGDRRITWAELDDRAARLAAALLRAGLGPGSTVGLLLHNAPEYLEGYFAALKIRAVPFNVNFRYTADEVAYLLDDAAAEALLFHAALGPVVAGAVARASSPPALLVEVPDGAGATGGSDGAAAGNGDAVPGATGYDDLLVAHAPAARIERDPGDRTMVYTGGTTGMPKGVLSSVGPPLANLLATVPPLGGHPPTTIDDAPDFAAKLGESGGWLVSLPASPLMHGTGLLIGATPALATGGTVVLLEERRFDADALWDTVAREGVTAVTIVGDPFARPMLAALDAAPDRDLSSLRIVSSAGAMFSQEVKDGLLEHLPEVTILDFIAATEGGMGMSIATAAMPAETARFHPGPGVIVLGADDRPLAPGSPEPGLVAVPGGADGYHNDPAKSAATFRTIDGVSYAIPGDWATIDADGTMTLLGRGSSCINTAGEKVYAEEVEEVLKAHPSVADALVFGVDDERLGQRVVAVVSRSGGAPSGGADDPIGAVLAAARERLAAYKVPRQVVEVDVVPRTQVGKPDYPTARVRFAESITG